MIYLKCTKNKYTILLYYIEIIMEYNIINNYHDQNLTGFSKCL